MVDVAGASNGGANTLVDRFHHFDIPLLVVNPHPDSIPGDDALRRFNCYAIELDVSSFARFRGCRAGLHESDCPYPGVNSN